METPTIASREDWLRARLALLAQEKAQTKLRDEVTAARRALPWVRIDKEYQFHTSEGAKSLAQLFGEHSQLIVYHFMFGADWTAACKSCSFWADSFDGLAPHLAARDMAFTAVSSAPLDRISDFRERMGWRFEWVSSNGNGFNHDFDVGFDAARPPELPRSYNFGTMNVAPMDEMHGTSVFARDDAGAIYHTYSTYGRGLDATNAAYAYMDLTPKGRNEPSEGNPMAWVRYHTDY